MEPPAPYALPGRNDGRLWAVALVLSLLANLVIVGVVAFASIRAERLQRERDTTAPPVRESGVTVVISPDMFQPVQEKPGETAPPAPPPRPAEPEFARTSEDQQGKRPDKPAFIGERDTEATSDRAPDPNAPEMPSQKGAPPRHPGDFETTESNYRDGSLSGSDRKPDPQPAADPSPPVPVTPPSPTPDPLMADKPPAAEEAPPAPEAIEVKPASPPADNLLAGPNPVDVPVPKIREKDELKPMPARPAEKAATANSKPRETPRPPVSKPIQDPMFRGVQRKSAIVGSISRTGRSSLNVADSPLGRYQATISRAVELEWQRNCVRHRDFITPGYLTVRFFVEPTGKVRTVQFVGQMETGEVQKGFTLNSIRDAEIPAMPADLKKDYTKEPLELIFTFYF